MCIHIYTHVRLPSASGKATSIDAIAFAVLFLV